MRFAIRYRVEYRYSEPVFDQHNILRVTPNATPSQRVRGFRVVVEPSARMRAHRDYFGTEVVEFNVPAEHERLAILAEGEVSTEAPPEPPSGGWELIREESYAAVGGEFLLPTGDEPAGGALEEMRSAIRGDTPRASVEALCQVIPDRFEYRPGATDVGSTVDDLLEGGVGVCQDFVHLALLREAGVAARYVSGYLFAAPGDGGADSVEVDTHAWVEALLPAGDGAPAVWVGADPTNRRAAGAEHVKIGHGRYYGDVAPIKGVYRGTGAAAEHEVNVRMTRLAALEA